MLRPGAPLVITFSHRCFPTQAVATWHHLDDAGHVALVARPLAEAGNWEEVTPLNRSPGGRADLLFAVVARTKATAARSADSSRASRVA